MEVKNWKFDIRKIGKRLFRQKWYLLSSLIILTVLFGANGCTNSSQNQEPEVIGKLKSQSSLEVESSVLGVGFETLDRKLFDPEKCYKPLGELGIKWARCQTGWNRCETVKGQYDFKWLDEVVDNLLAVGIQPWFNVGYGNELYTPGAKNNSAVGWIPMNSEEAKAGWENFVRALAEHYKGRVKHFELWNEPNVEPFWRPGKPSPEGYVEFIKRSEQAIHEKMPDAIIIGGGFGSFPFPTDFLTQCLELGLGKYIDRLSYHPYHLFPEGDSKGKEYQENVNTRRKLLSSYNPELALWQGECGCPSTNYSVGALKQYDWNESRQAKWLLRRLINDLRLELEMISWYHTSDQGGYGKAVYAPSERVNAYFGLFRLDDYSPKPSYFAFQNMCALFDTRTVLNHEVSLSVETADSIKSQVEVAEFSRLSSPLCAYWLRSDVTKDVNTLQVNAMVKFQSGLKMKSPVLIDPMSGSVYQLNGSKDGDIWSFSNLPLKDYPMIITEKTNLEIAAN